MPTKSHNSKAAAETVAASSVSDAPSGKSAAAMEGGAETGVSPLAPAAPPLVPRKIYPIVKYGDPILEKNTAVVSKFDAELAELAEDMFASMYAAAGVGLAAPQIGKGIRMAVVDVTAGKNPEGKIVLVNPEIIHAEGGKARRGRLPEHSRISRIRGAAAVCDGAGANGGGGNIRVARGRFAGACVLP
jgi:hypothetical protein